MVEAGEDDKADGIHIARMRMEPNVTKRMAVLKRPRWSPAQGGKIRPKILGQGTSAGEMCR